MVDLGCVPKEELVTELIKRDQHPDSVFPSARMIADDLKRAFEKNDLIEFEYQLEKLMCRCEGDI